MAGRSAQQLGAGSDTALHVVTGQTTNASQGTRSTHAHGLRDFAGNKLVPSIVICQETATDVDHASTGLLTGRVHVVKVDNTNVTVRSEVASQTFTLYVG